MTYAPNPDREAKTRAFQEAAVSLREHAIAIDKIALILNDTAITCTGCGGAHFLFWGQRQLRARVTGTSERLREIADTLQRRAREADFLDGQPLPAPSSENQHG